MHQWGKLGGGGSYSAACWVGTKVSSVAVGWFRCSAVQRRDQDGVSVFRHGSRMVMTGNVAIHLVVHQARLYSLYFRRQLKPTA